MPIMMNAWEVVVMLVEQLLPRGSGENKVLSITLQLVASAVNGEEAERRVMFLFRRRGNYTLVLWNSFPSISVPPEDFKEWEVKANHDSGWRHDGVESVLRDEQREMRKQLEYNEREVVASFGFSSPRLVTVKSINYDRNGRKAAIEW